MNEIKFNKSYWPGGTWEGWLLIHGGLDYMNGVVGGTAGTRIIALVQWFLDDDAAFCNGLSILESFGRFGAD